MMKERGKEGKEGGREEKREEKDKPFSILGTRRCREIPSPKGAYPSPSSG